MVPKTEHWWQQTWFEGAKPKFVDLGVLDTSSESPRTVIDRMTSTRMSKPTSLYGLPKKNKLITEQVKLFKKLNTANGKRADDWGTLVDKLKNKSSKKTRSQKKHEPNIKFLIPSKRS